MKPIKIALNSRTSGKFKTEQINGRAHLVTQMVPIVGNTAMNRIFYPESDVADTYQQLNLLPTPAGHPTVNGHNVSAFHPLAMNAHNIGGFIRNPRRDGENVVCDFCIDVEVANAKEEGRETVRRIKDNEEVGVSTGLSIGSVTNEKGSDSLGAPYDFIGHGFSFDHVAILLNEKAAGAHAGTALVTNAEGQMEQVFIADVKPRGMEAPDANGMGISTNQLHQILGQLLQTEVVEQHDEHAYSWIRDTFPDTTTLIYTVEAGGERRLFKRSYSIDAAGKISLGADAVPVIEQTQFKPEASATNHQDEESEMNQELFVLSLIANSNGRLTTADKERLLAMSESDLAVVATPVFNSTNAKELLGKDGFDFEAYETYLTNSEPFAEFIAARDERVSALKADIIANSEWNEDDLADMPESKLIKLNGSVDTKSVDRIGGGNLHTNNALSDAQVVNYD